MHPKRYLTPIVFVLFVTGLACDKPVPFGRLVDHSQRVGAISDPESLLVRAPEEAPSNRETGASLLPTATIDDDTRHVLAAHRHQVIAAREAVLMPKPDIVRFGKSIEGLFPGAENLLINVRLLDVYQRKWQIRPPLLVHLERNGEEEELFLDLSIDAVPEGSAVQIWVDAYQAPPIGGTRYVTLARPIPTGSRMDFSFGIMEPAVGQGPVRFSISACDQDVCDPIFDEVFDPEQENRSAWQERSVSLSAVWGLKRSLKFEAVPTGSEALSLPVWANPRVVTESRNSSRPNVILLSIDTLRRDHLSLYGYERETTPFISNHLAANGATFENLVSEAASTEPSHMTLFTSLPALVHGATSYGSKLAVPVVTLAEAFRDQGYETAAFTEGGPLVPDVGFRIGFDRWKQNSSYYFLFPLGQVEQVFAQAWDWIVDRRDRPFFLFLHTFQVHHPLSPPKSYLNYFLEEEGQLSLRSIQLVKYDQEIRYVDDELAKLWTRLEDRGHAQNTILVLVSDHGDEFWEHGERGHGSLPYEEVLNVPLVFVGPTVAKGLRDPRPLHHVDVMPTILELAGIPVPEHVLGISFANAVRGTDPNEGIATASRVRISTSWLVPDGISIPVFVVRDQHLKVIRYERDAEMQLECFDLQNDPGEKSNLCENGPTERAKTLLSHLESYESLMEEKRLFLGGESTDGIEPTKVPLSPEHEDQLRALGYID